MEEQEKISFQVRESRLSLVVGGASIAFAVFIFVMWLLHLKGGGGGALLYLPLLFMVGSGVAFWVVYFNKKVTVEEMNIHYVNSLKKKKCLHWMKSVFVSWKWAAARLYWCSTI